MTEISASTQEALEHAEHSHHAAESGESSTLKITLSIAVMSVIGGILGASGEIQAGHTFVMMNEAVLKQTHASDTWAEYQADSIKQHVHSVGADLATAPDKSESNKKEADNQNAKKPELKQRAEKLEEERDTKIEEAETHFSLHHWFIYAQVLVGISIALSSVALLAKRSIFWYLALGGTAAGIGMAFAAYFHFSA
ncbi:MAG TPA: DUF4337 domain-containing protein [Alphaproteobacteria bacterium]|jgi:hypothetical protein|nr:DUF4337 domain-containing protein [Alphaproteobacteria bacterium]